MRNNTHKKRILTLIVMLVTLIRMKSINVFAESNGTFIWERDAWAFPNFPNYFQNVYENNLLPSHKKALYDKLNHVEYHLIEPLIYQEFGGCCYGFAATSFLASLDIFNPDEHLKELPAELAEKTTGDLYSLNRLIRGSQTDSPYFEQSIICYYTLLQTSDAIRQESVRSCDWSTSKKLSFLMEQGEQNKPVFLIYNGLVGDNYFGHAVLSYGIEYGIWEWNDETYEARILIYDSNNPYMLIAEEDRQRVYDRLQLYFKLEEGKWEVPMYHLTQDNCSLIGITNNTDVINEKGILSGTEYHLPDWTDVVATNQMTSPYTVTCTDSGEALTEHPWFYMDGDEQVRQNFVSDTANSCYTIQVKQPQQLHSGVYYQDLAFQCDSDAGSKIVYDPSGCLNISGDNAAYSLTMVLNEDYPTQWYDVQAKGKASNAALQKEENGYLLTADDLHDTSLLAKNLDTKTMLTVSTDAKAVLFTESETGQLTASVDLDGNGSYETEIGHSLLLGDLNGDDTVNASDAAMLLIAAAEIGAGNESGLTEAQEIAADVDSSRKINASDAANILIYAAETGAGSFSGALAEYMRRDAS